MRAPGVACCSCSDYIRLTRIYARSRLRTARAHHRPRLHTDITRLECVVDAYALQAVGANPFDSAVLGGPAPGQGAGLPVARMVLRKCPQPDGAGRGVARIAFGGAPYHDRWSQPPW